MPGGPPVSRGVTVLVPEPKHIPGSRFHQSEAVRRTRRVGGELGVELKGVGPMTWTNHRDHPNSSVSIITCSRTDLDLEHTHHEMVSATFEALAGLTLVTGDRYIAIELDRADRRLITEINDVRSKNGLPRLVRDPVQPHGPTKRWVPYQASPSESDRRISISDRLMSAYLAHSSQTISKESTIKLISDA